jgi:pimeloyl-ACP methyl ester carboxylesterase
MLAPFRRDFIGATRQFVTGSLFRKDASPALVRRVAGDMSQAPPQVALAAMNGINEWDGVSALQDIAAPLVLINSDLQPPADEARMRRWVPRFRLVTLAGTGHFLMMEDPRRFNPVLIREIDTLLAR